MNPEQKSSQMGFWRWCWLKRHSRCGDVHGVGGVKIPRPPFWFWQRKRATLDYEWQATWATIGRGQRSEHFPNESNARSYIRFELKGKRKVSLWRRPVRSWEEVDA